MDRNAAAEEFAKMLYQVGYKESVTAFFNAVNEPRGQDKQTWEAVKNWYENENDEIRQFVQFVAKEAIIMSVFGLAVHFDGAAGYHFVSERPAEFPVMMRVYENFDAVDAERPQESIEICPTQHGEDVHDIFLYLVDEGK